MIDTPVTRYAVRDGVSLAYQAFGDADINLVFVPGSISHVDLHWQDRRYSRFMERLAAFARVAVFDKRGMGGSDPVSHPPTVLERADDIESVMDAAGFEDAVLFGISEGGTAAMQFAVSRPARTRSLVLWGTFPAGTGIQDPEPDFPADVIDRLWRHLVPTWKEEFGTGVTIKLFAPALAENEHAVATMAALERAATTPAMFRAMLDGLENLDMRTALGQITAPTLVVHRRGDMIPIEGARYIAGRVRGARLVEFDGDNHLPWLGDMDSVADEVEEFVTGTRPRRGERRLATVLFTDIVGSTERAVAMGDRRWRALLDDHHAALGSAIVHFDGRLVKTIGDGALALFDVPADALRCAHAAIADASSIGIELRAGLHSGECEIIGDDVGGIAVHVGARIAAMAGPGEVLASSTLKDLVAGSGLAFADRGEHDLKGVDGRWRVFALDRFR